MQIPAGWNPLTTQYGNDDTTAFFHTPEFTVQVTHKTRDMTTVQVREGWFEGYDFQGRENVVDFGFHRNPADAFRFAAAYLADGGADFRRAKMMGTSPRYSRAVDVAYA